MKGPTVKRVGIFGGGIAGLTTAIALGRHGYRCQIYERMRQVHEAGMGFILLREASASLQAGGISLRGVPLYRYRCLDSSGTLLHQQNMPGGAIGLRRSDLISALVNALPEDKHLSFDSELDSLEFDGSGAVEAARLASGRVVQADLYVGADGMRSRIRHALFPDWPACLAQVQEITGLARSADVVRWAGNDFNKFHVTRGGVALGVVPVDSDHVVWYMQFDSHRFSPSTRNVEGLHSFVRALVSEWADPVPDLVALTDPAQVYLWRPLDVDLIPYFHQKNLVLVGDAAHPLLPFTSQGVCSAIADAVTLAELLSGCDDPVQVLNCYSEVRRAKCAPYIHEGRKLRDRFLMPLSAESVLLPIVDDQRALAEVATA